MGDVCRSQVFAIVRGHPHIVLGARDSLRIPAPVHVERTEVHVDPPGRLGQPGEPEQELLGPGEITVHAGGRRGVSQQQRVERVDLETAVPHRIRLVVQSHATERHRDPVISNPETRIEFYRPAQRFRASLVIAKHGKYQPERCVSKRQFRVEFERFQRKITRVLPMRTQARVDRQRSQPGIGRRVTRIQFDGPLERRVGFLLPVPRARIEKRPASQIGVVGLHVVRRTARGQLLCRYDFVHYMAGHLARDIRLDHEDVFELPVERIAPDLEAVLIDEPRGYTNVFAVPAHAALQQVPHAELVADAVGRLVAAPECKRGCRREHVQHIECGQPVEDFLGDAVGKIAGIGIGIEIGEREDGNRVRHFLETGSRIRAGLDFFPDLADASQHYGAANSKQCRQHDVIRPLQTQIDGFRCVRRLGPNDALRRNVVGPAEDQRNRETRNSSNEQVA